MNNRSGFAVAGLVLVLLGGGLYWWEQTLSHDFRRAAVDAVAELDSFGDTGACSGVLLYGFAVQRIDLAVHKAEAEVSTVADRRAAEDLRAYYEALTDRGKACSEDSKEALGQAFAIEVRKNMVDYDLGVKPVK